MMSYMYCLVAFFVVIRLSSQGVVDDSNFSRSQRNFFMSSGPSRARVMEMERLVSNMFPRKTRADDAADSMEDIRPAEFRAVESVLLPGSNEPCVCSVFSRCIGKCDRMLRYW